MPARLSELSAEVHRFIATDRKFFYRHPHRKYRIRRACAAEIEVAAILTQATMELPPIRRWYTRVRQVREGERLRVFLSGPADADTDIGDDAAERLWRLAWSRMLGALEKLEQSIAEFAGRLE